MKLFLEMPNNLLVQAAIAGLYTDPHVRTIGHAWNGTKAELPDGREGEVVGNYWETNGEEEGGMKMLVAIPDAENAEHIVRECSTELRLEAELVMLP